MYGHRFRRRLLVAAAVTLGVVVAGGVPSAVAHTHPTPIERAAPGVVFIEARAMVEVALIEHHQQGDPSGVHIGIVQSTWDPVLASASGFVVDPNGAIVTTATVTKPDLERAKIYAVNQAFHKRYGAAAPLPANPFARHHVGGSTDTLDQRLQACYPPNVTNDAGGCVVRAVLDLVVYPYVTSQQRYGNLKAEVLPGATKDVAVLRVRGANSMPTVAVAQSLVGASALGVLGFTGVPSPSSPLVEINQHLAKPGTGDLRTTGLDAQDVKDAAHLKQALSQGLTGGPVVAERGQVIGFLAGPPRAGRPAPDLVSAAAILPVLKTAKVVPHSGPADTSYEDAMHLFKNGAYAAAIPGFTKALELFPGHYRAQANLAIAKQRAGASKGASAPAVPAHEQTSAATGGVPWLLVAGVAAVLLLVAVALLLLRRRRGSGATGVSKAGAGDGRAGPRAPAHAAAPAAASGRTARPAAPPRHEPSPGPDPRGAAPPSPSVGGRPVANANARSPSAQPSRQGGQQASSLQQAPAVPVPSGGYRFCTSCGGRLAAQHQYCGWCGEPVG